MVSVKALSEQERMGYPYSLWEIDYFQLPKFEAFQI